MIYKLNGESTNLAYDIDGEQLANAYTLEGVQIPLSGDDDYDEWYTEFQHSILIARDEWKTQYRADQSVIPLILHTDQHATLTTENAETRQLFTYLGVALKWNEVSACVGLGDVDMADYDLMTAVLNPVPRNKQINIWGNHDLWRNYTTVDNQFVIDFDSTYPNFNNETYGVSHAYNHKGIEYHIDSAHNVKYICLAGWEIDKSKGGYSNYIIGTQSMDDIIDMLEMEDGYDIVILSHCTPITNIGTKYVLCDGNTETLTIPPTETTGALTNPVDVHVALDNMLSARNNKTSGTITDVYGVVHSYDFTNCTGNIVCCLLGHQHQDAYGYSINGGILSMAHDAFAYGTKPFYMINIDRTNGTVNGWKITDDAVVQNYVVPLVENA